MAVASLRRPTEQKPARKARSIGVSTLYEDFASVSAGPLKVDREKRTIYGVKVCGLESKNGRRYPLEVLRAALPLYEGASVYHMHPQGRDNSGPRNPDDLLGRTVRPVLRDDGIYADLEYLTEDARTAKICEVAERMSNKLGLSHNIAYEGDYVNGQLQITRIVEVNSVDVVCDPATTNGLFEAKKMPTIREQLVKHKSLAKLIEDMGDIPDLDAPAAEPEAASDHKADLLSAVGKLLDSTDPADQELAASIMKLLQKFSAPAVAEADDEPDEKKDDAAEEEGDDEKKDDKKAEESVTVAALRKEIEIRDLCESMGFVASPIQKKALTALEGDDRKQLAEQFKASTLLGGFRNRPRTGVATESANGTKDLTPETAGKRWRD